MRGLFRAETPQSTSPLPLLSEVSQWKTGLISRHKVQKESKAKAVTAGTAQGTGWTLNLETRQGRCGQRRAQSAFWAVEEERLLVVCEETWLSHSESGV